MKIFAIILLLLAGFCFGSAFWLDYHSRLREENKRLKEDIEIMIETHSRLKQSYVQVHKEKNKWAMEVSRLKEKYEKQEKR